ncbi:MAG: sugar transferase [Sulfurospirillaceae bacterium]|nr:sugar transferase [Sulfurospirillaceae bacterium]
MQRFFDILFSGLALVVFSPFLIPIAIALKFTGEGEIFYVQDRIGKDGKKFGLLKFATMLKDSPNMVMGTVTVKNDPRVLPFGTFLRKTKINELPQLLNILLGDMSVIGPRPQTERCFLAFPQNSQDAIVQVKPGLSGIGSIVFRDEESILDNPKVDRLKFYDEVIAPYKGELEQWYVKHQNLYTYFMLIGLTVWVVLFSDSKVYKSIFKDLPISPESLTSWL